jgi:adenosine deaminase
LSIDIKQTDDVGVFQSPLSNEYLLAAENFGLNKKEIIELAGRPIEAIFAGAHEKSRLKKLIADFSAQYCS